jgi:serine/threonine protein kinase, bacterial
MSEDTPAPQPDDVTAADLTQAAYAEPLAWSEATSSQPVIEFVEPRWRGILPKLLAPAGAVAIGGIAVWLWMSGDDHPAPPPPSPTKQAAQPTPPQPAVEAPTSSAPAAADKIRASVPEVTELIDLTEDNDANNLIGRPNGYSAATVLVDSRLQCDTSSPGVDCGATVEQWPDKGAAQQRADYVRQIRESAPALGQEWTTVNGNLVLRVTGLLKPSAAEIFESAFSR